MADALRGFPADVGAGARSRRRAARAHAAQRAPHRCRHAPRQPRREDTGRLRSCRRRSGFARRAGDRNGAGVGVLDSGTGVPAAGAGGAARALRLAHGAGDRTRAARGDARTQIGTARPRHQSRVQPASPLRRRRHRPIRPADGAHAARSASYPSPRRASPRALPTSRKSAGSSGARRRSAGTRSFAPLTSPASNQPSRCKATTSV